MSTYPIVTSVGIEFECEDISSRRIGRMDVRGITSLGFRTTHDASCEKESDSILNLPVTICDSLPGLRINKETFGVELVSGIIDTEDHSYIGTLKRLTNELISLGESNKSYRAGFHVHVNTPIDLRILKSIMRLGKHLEQVFFLIGTMGYDYRGKRNDSTYCRPITKYGPPCVPIEPRSFAQCMNISDLLKCDSVSEFQMKCGNLDKFHTKYVPVRYLWLNVYPLWTQGSLEFRVFNKSLNPIYLYGVIELCKAFVYYAIESSFQSLKEDGLLKENSVFDVTGVYDRDYIIETFMRFAELAKLNRDVIDIITDIMQLGDINSIVLPKEYIYSHLQFHAQGNKVETHWKDSDYEPEVIKKTAIKKPEFLDIHNLRNGQHERPVIAIDPPVYVIERDNDDIPDAIDFFEVED